MATMTVTAEDIRIARIAGSTPETIASVFTPDAIYERANDIYEFLNENGIAADSWTREVLFEKSALHKNVDYSVLYDKWLQG